MHTIKIGLSIQILSIFQQFGCKLRKCFQIILRALIEQILMDLAIQHQNIYIKIFFFKYIELRQHLEFEIVYKINEFWSVEFGEILIYIQIITEALVVFSFFFLIFAITPENTPMNQGILLQIVRVLKIKCQTISRKFTFYNFVCRYPQVFHHIDYSLRA